MRQFVKALFLIILAICALLFGYIFILSSAVFVYGNHLILETPNGWQIDSVNIRVCKYETTFTAAFHGSDDPQETGLAGNIDPTNDKDNCAVIFKVYTPGKVYLLPADKPFSCSGCDINHYYLLTDSMAYALPWDYPYWKKDSVFTPPQ